MLLDRDTFKTVINSAPLVSIDLIVTNSEGQALLGKRLNRPAKGYWFVPGGRIFKNETLAKAFQRLTLNELGEEFDIENANLLGPYDHFYDDYVFGDTISTHYVAIAYQLELQKSLTNLPMNVQHDCYQWIDISDLQRSKNVHKHTKKYFE